MFKKIKEYRVFLLVMLLSIAIFNIELPYYVMAPGGIINVSKRVELDGKTVQDGSLNMLYVSEYDGSIMALLTAKILKNWDIYKLEDIQIANESSNDIFKRNKVMLDNANDIAVYVAYQEAGKEIKVTNYENVVIATTKDNNILIGDIILEVKGIVVENVDQIKTIIKSSKVNEKISLKIKRDNEIKVIESTIYEENNELLLGIVIITNYDYELNPKINIISENDEGGSSGGLMTALSIYNILSDEDIIKNRNISGTGTIDIEGNVGEIGGIKYKIMAAVKNKMDMVLVPDANYEEAMKVKKDNNYSIEIVKIKTFKDALEYLRK